MLIKEEIYKFKARRLYERKNIWNIQECVVFCSFEFLNLLHLNILIRLMILKAAFDIFIVKLVINTARDKKNRKISSL